MIDEKAWAIISQDEDSPYRNYPMVRRAIEAYENAKQSNDHSYAASGDWIKPAGTIYAEVTPIANSSQNTEEKCLHSWEGPKGMQDARVRNCKLCGKAEFKG